jgi:hypothetical protein
MIVNGNGTPNNHPGHQLYRMFGSTQESTPEELTDQIMGALIQRMDHWNMDAGMRKTTVVLHMTTMEMIFHGLGPDNIPQPAWYVLVRLHEKIRDYGRNL